MVRDTPIRQHPDLVEMRERYDIAAANPAVQVADGLTLLSGVYLALSPWIVGFTERGALTVNNLIVGIAVALLALGFSSAFGRTYGIAWVAPLLGLWTIFAPWIIRGDQATTATIWNNVIVGIIITVLGLAALGAGMMRRR
ncbi:hypothetical protein HNP84_005462 [Thermocatellispora tengchongensis]|uniref:SPW repeat-containing integral membrane domain-containing protein n=1 Tax=Thermocatellispora tengchongensis TaxID=1073253 RepID=A0A840P7R9_9ACTN|nr:SPW repeat protein [Thermocatellispora tengchongensis]MBB5135718.1 hypothetical protein [Thermocatellispora tengchongensis]